MECSICGITSDAGFEIFSDLHGSLVCRMCAALMDQYGVYDKAWEAVLDDLSELSSETMAVWCESCCGECGFCDAETTGYGYCHMWEKCVPWEEVPCEHYTDTEWVEVETDTTWEE